MRNIWERLANNWKTTLVATLAIATYVASNALGVDAPEVSSTGEIISLVMATLGLGLAKD